MLLDLRSPSLVFAMDPLSALRSAIVAGQEAEIVEEADNSKLHIAGHTYSSQDETAWMDPKTRKHFKLLAVWLMWKLRERPISEYSRYCREVVKMKVVDTLLAHQKEPLLNYLKGLTSAPAELDFSLLKAGGGGGGAAGGGAGAMGAGATAEDASMSLESSSSSSSSSSGPYGGAAAAATAGGVGQKLEQGIYLQDEVLTWDAVLQAEIPFRNNRSILEVVRGRKVRKGEERG